MVERYFALKLIGTYVVIGIIVIIALAMIGSAVIQDICWNRKIKLLEKNGFEKYLRGVPSVGNGAFYGWRREFDGKRIADYSIKPMSYKALKKWIEGDA
mgnify:CR=1 FL=1